MLGSELLNWLSVKLLNFYMGDREKKRVHESIRGGEVFSSQQDFEFCAQGSV